MEVLRIKRGATGVLDVLIYVVYHLSHKGPSTKDVRQMGRAGGFEISDIPGGGEGVICESSDFQNFSELFKVTTRNNYNISRFQYESVHI